MMAFVLGAGDAFHLVPRIINNIIGRFEDDEVYLGIGNMISSITMTIFYMVMAVDLMRAAHHPIVIILMICAIVRIGLCLCPHNNWFKRSGNRKWVVMRNVPFVMVGICSMILCLMTRHVLLTGLIFLSFCFYLIVVLLAKDKPVFGMFMIPKTICYIVTLLVMW